MNYQEIIKRLVSQAAFLGIKSTLENVQSMAKILGHPERKFPSIHVAGTNGKGSVCLKTAKSLEAGGYRCGLFTSPHLSSFRERIRINQEIISEEILAKLMTELFITAEKEQITLTYFEYSTLLAFLYFAEQKVDIAVIEVGLGGRLDATNILHPILSIITSISLDHIEILGSTEEEIAKEKAGIIKPNTPVVIGPRVPFEVISQMATQCKAALHQVDSLYPHYGEENRAVAKLALSILKSQFPLLNEEAGLIAEPSCRFELVPPSNLNHTSFSVHRNTPIILDVAHNKDGFSRLIERLNQSFPNKTFHFLLSLSSSKDIPPCAELITKAATTIHILDIPHPRLASAEKMQAYIPSGIVNTPINALNAAFKEKPENNVLVICGSFFVMNPIRTLLGYQEPRDD